MTKLSFGEVSREFMVLEVVLCEWYSRGRLDLADTVSLVSLYSSIMTLLNALFDSGSSTPKREYWYVSLLKSAGGEKCLQSAGDGQGYLLFAIKSSSLSPYIIVQLHDDLAKCPFRSGKCSGCVNSLCDFNWGCNAYGFSSNTYRGGGGGGALRGFVRRGGGEVHAPPREGGYW